MGLLSEPDFVYVLGNFMADGSFYISDNSCRFEFTDGSPYKSELKYSFQHLSNIKNILERLLNKKLPKIRKRDNRFVFAFRDKYLSELFKNSLHIKPGSKDYIANIPLIYKRTKNERAFWMGVLDGDGSIARGSKRIALESVSPRLIKSFSDYLRREKIFFSNYPSSRKNIVSNVILIRSVSFRDFAEKIGFNHPLKCRLLKQKLKNKKDFFIKNRLNIRENLILNSQIINYFNIFDDSVFVENGIEILRKYGYSKYHLKNVKLSEIYHFGLKKGINKEEILKEVLRYRFKKSKGSKNSIKLPLILDENLKNIAQFVRIRAGSISFSREYIRSLNVDYANLMNKVKNIFDISPTYTCKGEPLFCSGVLADFFKMLIKSEHKAINMDRF